MRVVSFCAPSDSNSRQRSAPHHISLSPRIPLELTIVVMRRKLLLVISEVIVFIFYGVKKEYYGIGVGGNRQPRCDFTGDGVTVERVKKCGVSPISCSPARVRSKGTPLV